MNMNDFVHEYYSVEMFRATDAGGLNPMTSKYLWTKVDLGYKIMKPKIEEEARETKSCCRINASNEVGTKKRKCTECHELGHPSKYCQRGLTARQEEPYVI
jgi:hypothetical protein